MLPFLKVKGLEELERNEMWDAAIETLYDNWKADEYNVQKLCRVLAECWYVMSEYSAEFSVEKIKFLKAILIETYQFGMIHFVSNQNFLWLAGYMSSMFPFYFYCEKVEDLYSKIENEGIHMLLVSTQIEPQNLLFKVLYLGTLGFSEEYDLARHQLMPKLNTIFAGASAIERYFKEVLKCTDKPISP